MTRHNTRGSVIAGTPRAKRLDLEFMQELRDLIGTYYDLGAFRSTDRLELHWLEHGDTHDPIPMTFDIKQWDSDRNEKGAYKKRGR